MHAASATETRLEYNPDRFAGDPPLSDDERRLSYSFDPARDYYAEIDTMQPPWVPPAAKYLEGSYPSSAAFSDASGPRELRVIEKDPRTGRNVRRTRTMPHKRYVRAIDPQGNLCSLIVSTCRPDRDKPNGDDGLETASRVIARKSRIGWVVVERDEDTHNPFSGKTGQDYAAWALAVMAYRRRIYSEWLQIEQRAWYDEQKARAIEIAELQGKAMGEAMKKSMAETVRDAMAPRDEAATARRGKMSDRSTI